MKNLEKIILVQYFVCEAEEIQLQGHTAFLGPNGTGKSALLDAIQIAMMGGDLNNLKFNVKSAVKDGRTLRDYCLGYYRPPEAGDSAASKTQRCRDTAHTYIGLVFRDSQTGEHVSAGVAIVARQDDDRHKVRGHYVVRGMELALDDHLQMSAGEKAPLPWAEFQVALREKCARAGVSCALIHDGARSYVRELLHALQPANVVVDPDEFRKAFGQSLDLHGMTDVGSLVRTFVIDEMPIDRQRATSQISHFRELEQVVRNTEVEIAELHECESLYKRLHDAARREASYQALQHILDVEALNDEIVQGQDDLEGLESQGARIAEAMERLEGNRQGAQQRLLAHRTLMASSASTQELLSQNEQLVLARRGAERTEIRYRVTLGKQFDVIKVARSYADLPEPLRASLKALEQRYNLRADVKPPIKPDEAQPLIMEAAGLLREACKGLRRLASNVQRRCEEADKNVEEIEKQIAHAETGGGRLDRIAAGALSAFHKANLDARPVSDLVRVRDPEWQPAIEAFLGRNCFSFLLPGLEAERQALRLARAPGTRLNKSKIIRVGLIRDEHYGDPSPNLVSSLLESEDRHALAYVRMLLGKTQIMRSDADLEEVPNGLSIDGVLNKNAANEILDLPGPGQLVLGRTGSTDDLSALRSELSTWQAKANTHHVAKERIDKLIGQMLPVSDEETLRAELDAIAEQNRAAGLDVSAIEARIVALQTGEAAEMQSELERLVSAAQEADRQHTAAVKQDADRRASMQVLQRQVEDLSARLGLAQAAEKKARAAPDYDEPSTYEIRDNVVERFKNAPEEEQAREAIRFCADQASRNQKLMADAKPAAEGSFRNFLSTRQHDPGEALQDWRKAYAWVSRRKQLLVDTELVRNKELASNARSAAEEAFRKDVAFKLRDAIAGMKATIRQINGILQKCKPFSNGETYRFSSAPARLYATLHDYIVNAGAREQGDMFNENNEIATQIMEYLVPSPGAAPLAVNPLEDFRLMFDFDLDIYTDGVKTSSLSRRMGLGSNGEHLCPFHVIVAAALHHAYRLDERRDSGGLCLMMLDEAFSAMDDQNALAAAQFISDLGLQLIMAGPSADCGKLSSFTQTIYELDRWDDKLEFHREELTAQAHALLQSDMPAINPELVRARAEVLANASA